MREITETASVPRWTFLSNYAHVLICVAQEPGIRLRDVAERVGITERAVQRIVADLEEAGYLTRVRRGRRNHYEVHADRALRHSVVAHREVGVLLELILGPRHRPNPSGRDEAPHFWQQRVLGRRCAGFRCRLNELKSSLLIDTTKRGCSINECWDLLGVFLSTGRPRRVVLPR